jgi:hypothetical protein
MKPVMVDDGGKKNERGLMGLFCFWNEIREGG